MNLLLKRSRRAGRPSLFCCVDGTAMSRLFALSLLVIAAVSANAGVYSPLNVAKILQTIFNNSISVSQELHCLSVTVSSRLTLFFK